MKTITISITYSLKWQIKGFENYKVSPCGKIFNMLRNKEVKRVRNGGSIGFWIKDNFFTLSELRKKLELIKETDCPF